MKYGLMVLKFLRYEMTTIFKNLLFLEDTNLELLLIIQKMVI